jgi:hypothetical protein
MCVCVCVCVCVCPCPYVSVSVCIRVSVCPCALCLKGFGTACCGTGARMLWNGGAGLRVNVFVCFARSGQKRAFRVYGLGFGAWSYEFSSTL